MDDIPQKHGDATDGQRPSRRAWIVALVVVPTLLTVTIGWFGANFSSDPVRSEPFGGDYLQEWIGGRIIASSSRSDLYNEETFKPLQHDSSLVGFQWPDGKYFPMVYPPFYYAAVSPLSNLDYQVAARIWLGLMAVALGAAGFFLWRMTDHKVWSLVLLVSCPVITSLTTGQKGTLLLIIVVATYWLLKRNREFAAGLVFGLIAFKPHLGLPIGIIMLCRGRWRFCLGSLVSVLSLVSCCLLTGWDLCISYAEVCLGMGDYVSTGGYHLEQSFSAWSGWQLLFEKAWPAKFATITTSLLVLIGTLTVTFRQRGNNTLAVFNIGLVATVLMAPHLYFYDLTLLILPAVASVMWMQNNASAVSAPTRGTLLGGYALLFFATPMLVSATQSSGLPLGSSLILILWLASLFVFANRKLSSDVAETKLATC